MANRLFSLIALLSLSLPVPTAWADEYRDTIDVFRKAVQSGRYFRSAYGYAVFPTIGKGGIGVGAAFGRGRVYEKGRYIGDASMTQLSIGFQLGGQAFSEIVFFEDQRALRQFTNGSFEFGAEASAIAITAAAGAKANTAGTSAGASTGQHDATIAGSYNKGLATFTVAKGGFMYEASIGGQKFAYTPR